MIRKAMRWWGPILPAVLIFTASPLEAATFNPSTATEFQAALDAAEANNEDDVIQLPASDFSATDLGGFSYSSGEIHGLTIRGAGIGETRLIGDGNQSLLYIGAGGSGPHGVLLSGISFQGGSPYGLSAESDTASFTVENCEFSENNFGLFFDSISAKVSIKDSVFSANTFAGMSLVGGAEISVQRNAFRDHLSESSAVQIETGDTEVHVLGNLFENNAVTSTVAGLFLVSEGNIELIGNRFLDNSSEATVSAVRLASFNSNILVAGNLLSGNSSDDIEGSFSASFEGEILFVNNTVAGNSAGGRTAGIYLTPDSQSQPIFFYNNILDDNTVEASIGDAKPDVYFEDGVSGTGNPVTFSHNLLGGGFAHTCTSGVGCTPNITETGAVPGAPKFFDAENGDFNLAAGSPAIGAGDPGAPSLPSLDLEGRSLNDPPDLGAFAAAGRLTLDPLQIDFGNLAVGASANRELTLINHGALPLALSAVSLSDSANYSFDASVCAAALAPDGECVLVLTFDPSAEGSFPATLTIESDDSTQASAVVSLTGVGTAGAGNGGDDDLSGDGGCSLGGSVPAGSYALGLMIPLLWGLRRFRK